MRGRIMNLISRIYSEITSKIDANKTHKNPKNKPELDAFMIIGPNSPGLDKHFEQNAKAAGLTYKVLGDGINPVTKEMVIDARKKGLIGPNTEVFCHFHGNVSDDNSLSHLIEINDSGKSDFSTVEFLHWLRDASSANKNGDPELKPWQGNINLLSCHGGNLRNTLTPDSELWKQGNLIVHSSRKDTLTDVGMTNFGEVIRLLGECKRNGLSRPDGMEMIKFLSQVSGDTVSLLGGELEAALSVSAPKNTAQAMPGYLEAQWKQQEAWEKLSKTVVEKGGRQEIKDRRPIKGEISDIEKFMEVNKSSNSERRAYLKNKNVIFTRVGRGKLGELKSDLEQDKAAVRYRDSNGNSLLFIACSNKMHTPEGIKENRELVKFLIKEGSDIDAQNFTGNTVMHNISYTSDVALARILLEGKANVNIENKSGWTPLHSACFSDKKNINMVKLLLSNEKTEINKRTKDGKTALHYAVEAGRLDVVKLLIENGAKIDIKDKKGYNPLRIAKKLNNIEIEQYLIEIKKQ